MIYNTCSIVVDVSYSYVLGDIGWVMGGNLNASRLFHLSYGVLLQCLYCIAILIGLYFIAEGMRKRRVATEWCNNWRVGNFWKCVKKKNNLKKENTAFLYFTRCRYSGFKFSFSWTSTSVHTWHLFHFVQSYFW